MEQLAHIPLAGWIVIAFIAVLAFILLMLHGVRLGFGDKVFAIGAAGKIMDKKLAAFKSEQEKERQARVSDKQRKEELFRRAAEIDENTKADELQVLRRIKEPIRDMFAPYVKCNITGGVVGASELYTKYEAMPLEKRYFERIPYKAGMQPEAGDVVIFAATKTNQYGHVAIALNSSAAEMAVFEQDGFKQNGAYIRSGKYERVLGFLRRR